MRHASLWLSALPVALLAACIQVPAPPADTSEADAAAIRASTDSFLSAWNAADVNALGLLYDADVIQMPPDGPPREGPAAVLQGATDYFAQFTASQTATVTDVSVHGDLGIAHGTWTVHETPRAGGEEQVRRGKWLIVSRRQTDGSWRTWRWIWNQEGDSSAAT